MTVREASAPPVPTVGSDLARFGVAVLIGFAVGVATALGQSILDYPWAALANSASPWLAGGFAAGACARHRGWGVAGGVVATVVEVVGYYVVIDYRGYTFTERELVFWTACAVVGGALFGWAGWAWSRADGVLRDVGAALLPATFVAEAIGTYWLRLHYYDVMWIFLGIGAGVLVALLRSRRAGAVTAWYALAMTAAGIVVYGNLDLAARF